MSTKQFGGKVTQKHIERYQQSPQWDGKKFLNLEETKMDVNIQNMPKLLYKQIFKSKGRVPQKPLPLTPFDPQAFMDSAERARYIWYGHSAVLMRIGGLNVLIDPMLGDNASPIAPFKTKRFSEGVLNVVDDLPEIDLLLLSHDHYDHLDLDSIKRLLPKVKNYLVALGTARHLVAWGVNANNITEVDWWDEQQVDSLKITFTPSRHFSGRGLTDRAKSLWGGWVIQSDREKVYFSGDGGYGEHFKAVGDRLGPFDLGFMECGQYNENWHAIHMYPEESVQAALDAKVKRVVPVHWCGFALAQHHWKEPVERFAKQVNETNLQLMLPQLGEMFTVDSELKSNWWESHL